MFRKSPALKVEVEKRCSLRQVKFKYFKIDVEIRWNSILAMLERFLQLYPLCCDIIQGTNPDLLMKEK